MQPIKPLKDRGSPLNALPKDGIWTLARKMIFYFPENVFVLRVTVKVRELGLE